MRQVTEKTASVFLQNDATTISMSNTNVTHCNSADEKAMFLHGNCIAFHDLKRGVVEISNAGWESNTTKERLNGILELLNRPERIFQNKGTWYIGKSRKECKEFPYNKMVCVNSL